MQPISSGSRVAVVGGGIAGLAAAHVLAEAGTRVTILDKGRGPGGRASTRRRGAHQFDHGAQYFTARDPRFVSAVRGWKQRGVVAEWDVPLGEVSEPGAVTPKPRREPRYVGVPGMSAVARALAAALPGEAAVHFATRVTHVERSNEGWRLRHEGDAPGVEAHDAAVDALLVCLPAPQALELLAGRTALEADLRRATMEPCWSAMAAFDARLPIAVDGLFVNIPDQPLGWASRDTSKPGRPAGERWVLHATPAWTRAHFDHDPAAVARTLLGALGAAVGRILPAPVVADAHRWRYAQGALDPAPGALVDEPGRLVVAGDWCQGGRVEGAWLSGVAAAERLLDARLGAPRAAGAVAAR